MSVDNVISHLLVFAIISGFDLDELDFRSLLVSGESICIKNLRLREFHLVIAGGDAQNRLIPLRAAVIDHSVSGDINLVTNCDRLVGVVVVCEHVRGAVIEDVALVGRSHNESILRTCRGGIFLKFGDDFRESKNHG